MKTIVPVQGGFLARVTAPRIEAEGTFPTRELAEAGARLALDQIARGVAPEGRHDLTGQGIQPSLPGFKRESWAEKRAAAPMRRGAQVPPGGLFDR